jgi:ATP-dependent RNA helicase DHX8/PRP22
MKIPLVSSGEDTESVRKCFTSAFFMNAAVQQGDGTYKTLADSKIVAIHPSSVMFNTKPPCVLYNELVLTKKQYIREVILIDYQWLLELAPHFYTKMKK